MPSDLEEIDPGWTPLSKDGVPLAPGEALGKGTGEVSGGPCVIPWVPGLKEDGSGAFEITPETWLGSPLTVKEGNSFDAYLSELLLLARNYNHWLYRLRRMKVMDSQSAVPACGPMPNPPGQTDDFGPDTFERTDREFTAAANELTAKLTGGFEGAEVIMDPVRVNDYIVSVRVVTKGGSAARGPGPGQENSSSSHVSNSSNFSSSYP